MCGPNFVEILCIPSNFVDVVAHKVASLVVLHVDIHGVEVFIQSLVEWPIFPVEFFADCRLKFPDLLPCMSQMSWSATFCTRRMVPCHLLHLRILVEPEQSVGWTGHQAKLGQGT